MSSSDVLAGLRDSPPQGRRKGSPYLIIAILLMIFAAVAGATFLVLRPTTLRIAVGPSGSEDQNVIQALAQTFSRDGSSVRLALVTTAGAVDSIAALTGGKADLAVARTDEHLPNDATTVAILRKNVVVLWAPSASHHKGGAKDAKIKEIADLAGHHVGVVGRTDVNPTLLRIILSESGVSPDKVTITQFSAAQINEMVRDTAVDAFMMVAPADSKLVSDAIAQTARFRGEPVFLPVDVSEAIAARHPLYESEEIPGSAFSSSPARPEDKVETVSVDHVIVAPKSLSATTVGTLTAQLFAARPAIVREIPGAAKMIEKPNTDKDAALPAHPGAAAYIDGTERTFMEKYSDYIWGGVLLLSVLGSASAGVRHYVKRDERRIHTQHREKLLLAIDTLRQVDNLKDLDAIQHEADEILRETLKCYDDGAIEEGDLTAYGLVLDQFHNAIVDRRAAVLASPDAPRMRA
jgi:TRAP transporter TAXI family solute receptor